MYGGFEIICIYMSDDDFPNDGSVGYYQGDIMFFDVSGDEQWVSGGTNWFSIVMSMFIWGIFVNGVGGNDFEFGYVWGMFGDESFWNQSDFSQGVIQDYYIQEVFILVFFLGFIVLIFSVYQKWFYEDFVIASFNSFDFCEVNS